MKIDLNKIKANMAARSNVQDAEIVATNPTPSVPAPSAQTPDAKETPESGAAITASALEVAKQVQSQVRKLPTPDPKLSDSENYMRELEVSSLHQKIVDLQQALLNEHPTMPVLLKEIHSTLQKQPDNVTLIDDDEIGIIFQGLLKYTGTEIALTTTKKKGAPKVTGDIMAALGL